MGTFYNNLRTKSSNLTDVSITLDNRDKYKFVDNRLTLFGDQDLTLPDVTWSQRGDIIPIIKIGTGQKRLLIGSDVSINALKYGEVLSNTDFINITGGIELKVISDTEFDLTGDYNIATVSPLNLSGLRLWLDPHDLSTFTKNGGGTPVNNSPVTTWADKSGNGYDFTRVTLTNMPLYKTSGINGGPSLDFDGVDDSMDIPYVAGMNTDAFHLKMSLEATPDAAAGNRFYFDCRGASGGFAASINGDGQSDLSVQSPVLEFINSNRSPLGLPSILSNSHSNSILQTSFLSGGDASSSLEVAYNKNTAEPTTLGSDVGSRRYKGLCGDVILYDNKKTGNEEAKLNGYLSWKHNIEI
jgi:hypothetical protein